MLLSLGLTIRKNDSGAALGVHMKDTRELLSSLLEKKNIEISFFLVFILKETKLLVLCLLKI